MQPRAKAQQSERNTLMVNESKLKGRIIFECELCGSSFEQLETAELCEQYCFFHGRPSPTLTRKSLRKSLIPLNPISVLPSVASKQQFREKAMTK